MTAVVPRRLPQRNAAALEAIFDSPGRPYAIVDAARNRRVLRLVKDCGERAVRHFAFAAETDQGIAIFHARYTRDGALGPFTAARYEPQRLGTKPPPPPRLFTSVPPALHVDANEETTAGFVAVDGKHLFRLEARFLDGSPEGGLAVSATPLTPLPEPPVSGALLYVDGKGHAIARREVVLLLAGGGVVRLNDGSLQRLQIQGVPTHPMLLLPGRDLSYILYTDPVRGLYLEQVQ
jgi:hypothetical protein